MSGLIMPKLQHRWRLHNISGLTEEAVELIRNQVTLAHFDYNQEVSFESRYGFESGAAHKLLLVIEEPLINRLEDIITQFSNPDASFDITIDNMDYDNETLRRAVYHGCKLKRYTYKLDYAANETCKYPLQFAVQAVSYPFVKAVSDK